MKPSNVTPNRKAPRKPPPNYRSRAVQVRLLLLISMLMLVLFMMQKAGNPQMWYWVWGGRPPVFDNGIFTDREPIDTRLPDAALERSAGRATSGARETPPTRATLEASDDVATRVELDAWRSVVDSLDADETRSLWAMLQSTRDDETPNLGDELLWSSLLSKLSSGWRVYIENAAASLEALSEEMDAQEKSRWLALLESTQMQWRNKELPAFESLHVDTKPTEPQLAVFARVQNWLDRLAWEKVEDDTVLWRKEFPAMFRTWERLQNASLEELESRSSSAPGFLSLFRQPNDYRGKLITMRGFAQRGYRLDAPKNYSGVKEYTVLWVRPVGGMNVPMVVYCLELPDGFPAVRHKVRDGGVTELNETVAFTGYFFKRWAYRAQDGSRTAPLLLAKAPRWTPAVSQRDARKPLSVFNGVLLVLGTAIAAILISIGVYFQSRWRSSQQREYDASRKRIASGLSLLEQAEPPLTVEESLRRFRDARK